MQPGYTEYPRYRQADISLSLIGDAWEYIKKNLGTYVGFTLIVLLGGQIVATIFQGPGQFSMDPNRDPMAQFSSPGYYLGLVIQTIAQFLFTAGLTNIALKELGGQRADLSDGFAVFKKGFWTILLASFISTLATYIGLVLCILPGIAVAVLVLCTNAAIIDQRLSAIDALMWSFNNVKKYFWQIFGVTLVAGLAALLGICACCFGFYFTIPIVPVVITMVYHQLRFEEVGALTPTNRVDSNAYPTGYPESPTDTAETWQARAADDMTPNVPSGEPSSEIPAPPSSDSQSPQPPEDPSNPGPG